MIKSWKTSLGGILASAGMLSTVSDDPIVKTIATICGAIGALLLGLAAKDSNVTGGEVKQ